MASIPTLIFACLFIFSAMDAAAIAEKKVFKVGGEEGWKVPDENNSAMYNHWATSHRFHVGDALYFEYVNDSVLVVEKFAFFHCNTSNPTYEFNNGKAMIELTKPGLFFFISGAPHHCKKGQRLIVEVMHFHNISNFPPSIANPPEINSGKSPSPSPSAWVSASHSSGHGVSVVLAIIPMFVALVTF